MNPFLSKLGIKMEEYQLAQSSADFSPNLILAKATRESGKTYIRIQKMIFPNMIYVSLCPDV